MNKKFKALAILLAMTCGATMAFTATGCTDNNSDGKIDGDGGFVAPEGKTSKVTFWANCADTELEVFGNIVNKFNEEYKDQIEVTLVPKSGTEYSDALGATLAGSRPPDVFYVGDSGYKAFAEMNYLLPLDDYIKTSKDYIIDDMWDNVTQRYKYNVDTHLSGDEAGEDGKYYGVPKDLGPTVIFYNETFFEGAGITVISVDEDGLDAFNRGGQDDRGKTKAEYGLDGVTVKEKGFFKANNKWYFNNQIPMNWEETVECSNMIQSYMRTIKGKEGSFGYFTEWWFNYGWSVGGNCIQRVDTTDPSYSGYYYDFTLMDNTTNYIVADDVEGTVKVGKNNYSAGEIIDYQDKIVMSDYQTKIDNNSKNKKGTYKVTEEVEKLADEGKLNRLPSQREAFTEFVRLGAEVKNAKGDNPVDTVNGVDLFGYGITPMPTSIGGDSGKTTSFQNGLIGMLVDGRWNVTEFRKNLGATASEVDPSKSKYLWDVAPLPMYKEYYEEGDELPAGKEVGDIKVHGVEAGHSGSVALCIAKKSKVPAAAWKFIEYVGGVEGQTLQAEAGFAIPLQKDIANSEVFLQTDKLPRNSKVFIDAVEYEIAGDWWFVRDNEWIDDWANDLNGKVRNGDMTLSQFLNGDNFNKTFTMLEKYTKV